MSDNYSMMDELSEMRKGSAETPRSPSLTVKPGPSFAPSVTPSAPPSGGGDDDPWKKHPMHHMALSHAADMRLFLEKIPGGGAYCVEGYGDDRVVHVVINRFSELGRLRLEEALERGLDNYYGPWRLAP